MTALQPDSFGTSSIGRQTSSKKETCPAFSFGTGSRDVARQKVFISTKHEKCKAVFNSPGPVYQIPTSLGAGPRYGFGQDEQRKHGSVRYPDSSVDLTSAIVDSQKVKFAGTPGVHFGTEVRMSKKNAEIIRTNPDMCLGTESPGALEYTPQETTILTKQPNYSFGPPEDRPPAKTVTRMGLLPGSTPRQTGPGSHNLPKGIGQQPQSARPSGPAWSMGGGGNSSRPIPLSARESKTGPVMDTEKFYSSLGKQTTSRFRSSSTAGFGRSTRDQWSRTAMCMTTTDRGPVSSMGKPNFHLDLPKTAPSPSIRATGL